jgi:DNA recombination protein RmuC
VGAEVDRRLQGQTEGGPSRTARRPRYEGRPGGWSTRPRQTNAIHKQLGDVGRGPAQLAEQAKDLGQLQQVLRPPKARGGFGELLLGQPAGRPVTGPTPIRSSTPSAAAERVDAVIRVDKLVPVDAKFPLDNFERLVDAQDDEARQMHEKAFARDVKIHIDAIGSKYIRPDEGTYDFALM